MKHLSYCFLLLLISVASSPLDAREPIRLGFSDVQNFPYQMGDGDALADPPGLAIDLIREAADTVGVPVEFVRLPVNRLLQSMQSGELDGSFIFSYKMERLRYGSYPLKDGMLDRRRRITTINYSFYTLADSPLRWDGKTLTGLNAPIGINMTFSIGDDLRRMGLPVDDGGRSTANNFLKLKHGRIAAYATLEDSGDSFLLKQPMPGVIKLEPPITSRDYYLMFGNTFLRQHSALAEQIWQQIGERRDQRTPALLLRYLE